MPVETPCWSIVRPVVSLVKRVTRRPSPPHVFVTPHHAERAARLHTRKVAAVIGWSTTIACAAGAAAPFLIPHLPGAFIPGAPAIGGGSFGFIPHIAGPVVAVPEPSSAALLVVAFAAVVVARLVTRGART